MSYKEDRDWTIFAHVGLNAIRNPSSTVSFEVRSSAMQKTNKQNNNKSTAIPLVFNTKYKRNFAGKYIKTGSS